MIFPMVGKKEASRHAMTSRAWKTKMKTIAIMGLGLMGSSLGLALKSRGVLVNVRAYARRAETRDAAMKLGAADAVLTIRLKRSAARN